MTTSPHAQLRMRQRGISPALLEIIVQCGRLTSAPGGAEKLCLGRREVEEVVRELKHMIQVMDKARGAALIIKDGRILTAYKNSHN